MELFPSIDLLGGRVVRLLKGDYAAVTVYAESAVALARAWSGRARHLHVVDLEGARDGAPTQAALVTEIVRAFGPGVQVGGGVRTPEAARAVLAAGAERVVLGTAALRTPEWVATLAAEHPGRVVLALDARGGKVATAGWLEQSETTAVEVARRFAHLPVAAVLYTDIDRDGTGAGPNLAATVRLAEDGGLPVIASGGVGTLAHLRDLASTGKIAGAIVGRALHEGRFTLDEALVAAAGVVHRGPGPDGVG